MLHPVSSDPARYDEPCGGAVPVRQRLAIHLESDERVFVERALDGQALQEIRRRGQYRGIGAVQHHFRSEEHTSELQSQSNIVCRLLLEKKKYEQLNSSVYGPSTAGGPRPQRP